MKRRSYTVYCPNSLNTRVNTSQCEASLRWMDITKTKVGRTKTELKKKEEPFTTLKVRHSILVT